MPRYDYECTACGRVIEIEHSIKDDAVEHQSHPDGSPPIPKGYVGIQKLVCDGKLKRLISKCMFNFKGGAPTPKHYS